jgi:hypothetical protein
MLEESVSSPKEYPVINFQVFMADVGQLVSFWVSVPCVRCVFQLVGGGSMFHSNIGTSTTQQINPKEHYHY